LLLFLGLPGTSTDSSTGSYVFALNTFHFEDKDSSTEYIDYSGDEQDNGTFGRLYRGNVLETLHTAMANRFSSISNINNYLDNPTDPATIRQINELCDRWDPDHIVWPERGG